MATAPKHVGAN